MPGSARCSSALCLFFILFFSQKNRTFHKLQDLEKQLKTLEGKYRVVSRRNHDLSLEIEDTEEKIKRWWEYIFILEQKSSIYSYSKQNYLSGYLIFQDICSCHLSPIKYLELLIEGGLTNRLNKNADTKISISTGIQSKIRMYGIGGGEFDRISIIFLFHS